MGISSTTSLMSRAALPSTAASTNPPTTPPKNASPSSKELLHICFRRIQLANGHRLSQTEMLHRHVALLEDLLMHLHRFVGLRVATGRNCAARARVVPPLQQVSQGNEARRPPMRESDPARHPARLQHGCGGRARDEARSSRKSAERAVAPARRRVERRRDVGRGRRSIRWGIRRGVFVYG